jgi:serine/threonine protein kinase
LSPEGRAFVCLRDDESKKRPGIRAALLRREGAGLKQLDRPAMNGPALRKFAQAMAQAGIRPRARRVGDFVLDQLVYESPTGIFQDWAAHHNSSEKSLRLVRIYLVTSLADKEDRRIVTEAARREIATLEKLNHPNILRALVPAESELGPGIVFDFQPDARRLDFYLLENSDVLDVASRFYILRQIADAIRYSHEKRVLHRALSPQSIFVVPGKNGSPTVQIYNWQTGRRLPDGSFLGITNFSTSLHAGQLVSDPARAYLAPESGTADEEPREEVDVFSLGALAYFLFSGKAPASDLPQLIDKLQASPSRALDIREALDGVAPSIAFLIENATRKGAFDRYSLEQFLDQLDVIEDEITTPDNELRDPRDAEKGSQLAHGFFVERRLGRGASAVALMVLRAGERWVLKLARDPNYNERLNQEFDVLKKLNFPHIAKAGERFDFGVLSGFTIEPAGEETLAELLKQEGPLSLEFLQRFGEELIETIRYLDSEGVFHRDVKPENIGIRKAGKESRRLCLFDFSLAPVSPNDLNVGTADYIDPFLRDRKSKRYDMPAELYSVAITLHQMATGLMPVWGDGKSHPRLGDDETMTLRTESLEPSLRGKFETFFKRALRRDFKKRFDNPRDMLKAWTAIFEETTALPGAPVSSADASSNETPPAPAISYPPPTRAGLLATATPGTPLAVLSLSTRLLNVLERLEIHTVSEVLTFRFGRFEKFRGVGRKTQLEFFELLRDLRERFPHIESGAPIVEEMIPSEIPPSAMSLDGIAFHVFTTKGGKAGATEAAILNPFLGRTSDPNLDPFLWPSQTDLADVAAVTRQRIGQVVTGARKRWGKSPALTHFRDELVEILTTAGGIMTQRELATAAVAVRGCVANEPERSRVISTVLRAAIEAEQAEDIPRIEEFRSAGRVYVALHADLKGYAVALGRVADKLAMLDPLPAPLRVLEELRTVPWPEDVDLPPLSDTRLLTLAVAAATSADLSNRGEIYPRGLDARRAITMSRNALFGDELTVAEVQRRITARFPAAAPLPVQPELDALLRELGFDLDWHPTAAEGQGAWKPRHRQTVSILSSQTPPPRTGTRRTAPPQAPTTDPEIAAASAIEKRLCHAAESGTYLILTAPPTHVEAAATEIATRFPVNVCDVDAVLLDGLKREAHKLEVPWDTVLAADGAHHDSSDWRNLQHLVDLAIPDLGKQIRTSSKTNLLLHPGLLARYDRLNLIAEWAADVGRPGGPRGLWVLAPEVGAVMLPTLNRAPIPITNAAQHVPLSPAWVQNDHRGSTVGH